MSIPQISTSNTFGQWLQTTQALVDKYNYTEETANLVFDTANNVFDTANLVFDTSTFIQNYVNTAFDTANTVLEISQNAFDYSNNAYDVANDAYVLANLAFETSNTFFETIFSIQDELTDANTYYPTFVRSSVGVPEDVYVTTTKFTFNPSTGTLSVVDLNSTSDISLKENVVRIDNSLNVIENLTGIKFNWKDTKEISYGLSAQEVEKVLPEIVKTRENGLKGVNYLNIIAILIESVKELKNEIENLKKHK